MKHLHFVQSLEVLEGGGLGGAALALHRAMRRLSVDSVLVATYGERPTTSENGVLEFKRTIPSKAYFAPKALSSRSRLLADADVVQGHGFYTAQNWIFGAAARKRGIPLLYHPQGMLEPWILARSRRKKAVAGWLFEDANLSEVALWRALTSFEADQIRAYGSKAPIVVAPNGIDVGEFPVVSSTGKKQRRRVLFLSRLHPKKGADILLRAWATLTAERKDWELVIAGPDEIGHRQTLEEIVRENDLNESVQFTGPVRGQKKIELIQSSDLFVLPSHSEGFPVAALEAMAACKPVILTPGCNFPEAADNNAGWIADADVASIAGILASVLKKSGSELEQRGLAGRALVERDYTWSAIARKLIDAVQAHIS